MRLSLLDPHSFFLWGICFWFWASGGFGLVVTPSPGRSLRTPNFFWLRAAPKDHQPPTANRHQPPTATSHVRVRWHCVVSVGVFAACAVPRAGLAPHPRPRPWRQTSAGWWPWSTAAVQCHPVCVICFRWSVPGILWVGPATPPPLAVLSFRGAEESFWSKLTCTDGARKKV